MKEHTGSCITGHRYSKTKNGGFVNPRTYIMRVGMSAAEELFDAADRIVKSPRWGFHLDFIAYLATEKCLAQR